MPTILTHPAVPLAIGVGLGSSSVSRRLLAAGAIASITPDFDVIAFSLGVPYGSPFGHRGFTHSLPFAAAFALAGAAAAKRLQTTFVRAFWFLFVAMGSHGVLDAFTTGGSGIALLWPVTEARYFAPVQVIAVSPIGIERFLTERGLAVLLSELTWVWSSCLVAAAALRLARRGFVMDARRPS